MSELNTREIFIVADGIYRSIMGDKFERRPLIYRNDHQCGSIRRFFICPTCSRKIIDRGHKSDWFAICMAHPHCAIRLAAQGVICVLCGVQADGEACKGHEADEEDLFIIREVLRNKANIWPMFHRPALFSDPETACSCGQKELVFWCGCCSVDTSDDWGAHAGCPSCGRYFVIGKPLECPDDERHDCCGTPKAAPGWVDAECAKCVRHICVCHRPDAESCSSAI
jgi:hypothetical protein